jgi:hypothetical protein
VRARRSRATEETTAADVISAVEVLDPGASEEYRSLVGMDGAPREVDAGAGCGRDLLAIALEQELALQDVEGVILAAVAMQGRAAVRHRRALDGKEGAARLLGDNRERHQLAPNPSPEWCFEGSWCCLLFLLS